MIRPLNGIFQNSNPKNRKKQNQTKQNENSKKTDKNCNIRRKYANKKKGKNIQGTVSI